MGLTSFIMTAAMAENKPDESIQVSETPRWAFKPEGITPAARYSTTREAMAAALPHLRLEPGMRVLEVGCGAGGYTEMLAVALQGKGQWVCLDHDEALLAQARGGVALDLPVSFEKGGA